MAALLSPNRSPREGSRGETELASMGSPPAAPGFWLRTPSASEASDYVPIGGSSSGSDHGLEKACFRPRTALVVLGAVALVAGFVVWAYSGCLTIPLSVSGPYVVPVSGSARERADRREIRVLSFNTFLRSTFITDPKTMWHDDWKEERFERIVDELDRFDVIAFQEVWLVMGEGFTRRLIEDGRQRGFTHFMRSPCGRGLCLMDGMLLLLSRHPLEEVSDITFEACSGVDCGASKGALIARMVPFGDEKYTFYVADTHLQATYSTPELGHGAEDSPEAKAREQQVAQLLAAVEGKSPLLIAGDLNLPAATPEWRHFTDNLYAHRIHDVVEEDLEATGPKGTGSWGTVEATKPEPTARLDYLLFRTGSGVERAGDTTVERFEVDHEPFTTLSDHFGVATTLSCK